MDNTGVDLRRRPQRSLKETSAPTFHLVWSWERSSTSIVDLVSEPFEEMGIDKILWDTNLVLHEAANSPCRDNWDLSLRIEALLERCVTKLRNHHPKTQMALYGLALFYSKGMINPRHGDKLRKNRVLLTRIFGSNEKVTRMAGNYYCFWKYIDDARFISVDFRFPSLSSRIELPDLLEEIRARLPRDLRFP